MAENDQTQEKTQEPTQRRLEKAREDGDILSSKEQGIHAFLIGESFMRKPSPGEALREILV